MRQQILTISVIVMTLALFRLVPHLPNISPIAAMALFGGAIFTNKRLAFIIPLLALFASDLIIGLHNSMIFVYVGFVMTVGIGLIIKNKLSLTYISFAVVASSVLFFLISNFGAWLMSGIYPQNIDGLKQAYVAGIPFFQNSLMGNVFFSAVAFGVYYMVTHTQFGGQESR